MKDSCEFPTCMAEDLDTQMVIVDHFGCHSFCIEHWQDFMRLFNREIIPCARHDEGCLRNHHAEYSERDKTADTVKYLGRYYDLCADHMKEYDKTMGVTYLFQDDLWG